MQEDIVKTQAQWGGNTIQELGGVGRISEPEQDICASQLRALMYFRETTVVGG